MSPNLVPSCHYIRVHRIVSYSVRWGVLTTKEILYIIITETTHRRSPRCSIFSNPRFIPPSLGQRNFDYPMIPTYFARLVFSVVAAAAVSILFFYASIGIIIKQGMLHIFRKGHVLKVFPFRLDGLTTSRIEGFLLRKRLCFAFHQGSTFIRRSHTYFRTETLGLTN